MNKKKFSIDFIEEGRLHIIEMRSIFGGTTCDLLVQCEGHTIENPKGTCQCYTYCKDANDKGKSTTHCCTSESYVFLPSIVSPKISFTSNSLFSQTNSNITTL
ncbi:MAG: hypothetical protein LBR51_00030 [Bacteroidales bacterium]|nr:hypothetical protein [Bacteroidales bacterium]